MEITPEYIAKLRETGNWMLRFDNAGISHNGFAWKPIGEWTEAPDWSEEPICEGGLFGQGPGAYGYCKDGTTVSLCETDGPRIVVANEKLKVPRARRICENDDVWLMLFQLVDGWPGSLYVRGYQHPLPAGLKSVGGSLHVRGYQHPLPAGLKSVGGCLHVEGYQHPLPAGLKSVGGSLYVRGYQHPLPAGLKSVGGCLYVRGYQHPLPAGLKSERIIK